MNVQGSLGILTDTYIAIGSYVRPYLYWASIVWGSITLQALNLLKNKK